MTEASCHWNSRCGREGALCVMKPGVRPWEREILETQQRPGDSGW